MRGLRLFFVFRSDEDYFEGVNSASRTFQVTDWPGLRVTVP